MTPLYEPDVWEIVLRLSVATVVGLLLGLNRELKRKPAGLRTLALVSLGSALAALLVLQGPAGEHGGDPFSRVIQGVITGIGFLGAGVIIQPREGKVRGLTTAAMIWVAAALGLASGAGHWVAVLVTTILIFCVLMLEGLEVPVRRWMGVEEKAEAPKSGGEGDAP